MADTGIPAEHEPIIERGIFEQVQRLLKSNSIRRTKQRQQSGALLAGLLYDDRGNRMSPSFSTKRGARYPFYISTALHGRKSQAGSVPRVPAAEIEAAVMIAYPRAVNGQRRRSRPHSTRTRRTDNRACDRKAKAAYDCAESQRQKEPRADRDCMVADKTAQPRLD